MARRKLTPLQEWRMRYAELSFSIRAAKSARRGHAWGDFKRPQAQRLAAELKGVAREYMLVRNYAAEITAKKWEADAIKRAAKLGHPIPNTTAPDNKIED